MPTEFLERQCYVDRLPEISITRLVIGKADRARHSLHALPLQSLPDNLSSTGCLSRRSGSDIFDQFAQECDFDSKTKLISAAGRGFVDVVTWS